MVSCYWPRLTTHRQGENPGLDQTANECCEEGRSLSRQAMTALPHALSILKATRSGLITDIDGTISPLAPSPDLARVSPICAHHLRALAAQLALVAVVSGRSAVDSQALVNIDGLVYVGNHGLEQLNQGTVEYVPEAEAYRSRVAAVVADLREMASQLKGTVLEDKGVTASIHYRQVDPSQGAREKLLRTIHQSPSAAGLWITEGKKVIEIRPPLRVDKGMAVRDLVDRYSLEGVVYLGDDMTDVDAFKALNSLRRDGSHQCLSIAVVGAETPGQVLHTADLAIEGVNAVEELLGQLVKSLR